MKFNEANSFLTSGGAPAVKFPTIGTTVKGTIINAEVSAQTDMATRQVRKFNDGNEMKQVVLTVETDERDPAIPTDDGVRRIFVKGHMLVALREALKATQSELETGGVVVVRFSATKPSTTPGFADAKQFEVAYRAPEPGSNEEPAAPTNVTAGSIEDLLSGSVLP